MIILATDGGARGNPGPAAYGVFITKNGKELARFGKTLGHATNNVAEYSGAVAAVEWLVAHKDVIDKDERVVLQADSQLLISQLLGIYKIKSPNLRELLFAIRNLEAFLPCPLFYKHVPRNENKIADSEVNAALDNKS